MSDTAPPLPEDRLQQIRRFVGVLDCSLDYRGLMLLDLLGEVDRLRQPAPAKAIPAIITEQLF